MTIFPNAAKQATKFDELGGQFDPWLIGVVLSLCGLGIIMVASSSMPYAVRNGMGEFHYVIRHLVFLTAGISMAAAIMRFDMKKIEAHSHTLLLLCVVLLALVMLPGIGKTVNGARRWINLGFTSVQPVEIVKLLFIVWLASYLVRFRDVIGHQWKALLKPLGVSIFLVCLLLVGKDFGSSMLLLSVAVGMAYLGGARLQHLGLLVLAGLPFIVAAIVFEPYRLKRIYTFTNPWEDPFDSGFQLVQALIAIGRGEFSGVGLGGSVLKLDYLPEAHTDFAFSVLAEELGFVGVCTVITLFALLAWRCFNIGMRCLERSRPFSAYCAFGIGIWVSLQSMISMGVNMGVLPTKGLTLPLISSGGSSVLMTCLAMGLMLRISYELSCAERTANLRRNEGLMTSPTAEFDDDVNSPNAVIVPVTKNHARNTQRPARVEPMWGTRA
jgi:cell division protein FtsW